MSSVPQHPVTLNTATPRNAGWKYLRNFKSKTKQGTMKQPISADQRIENVKHFIELLTSNGSTRAGAERYAALWPTHSIADTASYPIVI